MLDLDSEPSDPSDPCNSDHEPGAVARCAHSALTPPGRLASAHETVLGARATAAACRGGGGKGIAGPAGHLAAATGDVMSTCKGGRQGGMPHSGNGEGREGRRRGEGFGWVGAAFYNRKGIVHVGVWLWVG